MRYADDGGMNAKWEKVEMTTKTKKEGRVETAPADAADRRKSHLTTKTGP